MRTFALNAVLKGREGFVMGDVAIHYRVMPEGPDTNLEEIKAKLRVMGAREVHERPVGFGVSFLDVLFVVPDKEGPALEEKIRAIIGVESVETESITLV